MKLSQIKVDPVAINDGAWVGNLPGLKGVELRVRGFNSKPFRQLQAKLQRGVSQKDRVADQAVDLNDEIMNQLLVETILLDWRGIEIDDGVALPFSKDKAAELIADPAMIRFREAVIFAADVVGVESDAQVENDGKN